MKTRKNILRVICVNVILIITVGLLSSCANESSENAHLADPFIAIEGQEKNGLIYHRESKTVYVLFREMDMGTGYGAGYGYLAEYIVNGHNCKYVDNKIMEVIPNYEYIDNKLVEVAPSYVNVESNTGKQTVDDKWNSLTKEQKEELLEDK